MRSPIPEKLFFKIGEVSDLVGVKPHVLRYWESEFDVLKPRKTRSGHRLYRRSDVEILQRIRRYLHEEGYTIAGARRKLVRQDRGADGDDVEYAAQVQKLKTALQRTERRNRDVLTELKEQVERLSALVDD